jgi:diguanylate cyclase (GGDEF)-like protein
MHSGLRTPVPLQADWINKLHEKVTVDRTALAEPWTADGLGKGVDVFVALVDEFATASPEKIQNAEHLRIGINFDDVVRTDKPRVFREMLMFTIVVAFVMVVGLIVFLAYVLRPLRQLHLGLRALARGDLDYEVPVYSRDEVGQVVQAFNATTARLKAAFEQIEALATRDPLTGLPNRRLFDERLVSEAARSRRYGHPFGLIVMDLDKFKSINDTYGHPAGDEVLKYVAKMVEISIRETDVPARNGGEEYAIILPETNFDDVHAVAEKLRAAVAEHNVRPDMISQSIRVTLSAGAACSQGHLVTPEAMVAAADAALYQSKNEGRNRVTMAPRVAGKSNMLRKIEESAPDSETRSSITPASPGGHSHSKS